MIFDRYTMAVHKYFLLQALAITCMAVVSMQATIGDGTKSLYTGQLIDRASTRGACIVDGRQYPSDTAIPKTHPCHYCICYQGQVTCYWKQCAAAPENCAVLHFENTCNPSLYVCSILEKTKKQPVREFGAQPVREFGAQPVRRFGAQPVREFGTSRRLQRGRAANIMRISDTPVEFGARLNSLRRKRLIREANPISPMRLPVDEPFPVEFDSSFVRRLNEHLRVRRAVNGSNHHRQGVQFHQTPDKSCTILGIKYNLGEVIGIASDHCMECRCAAGNMYCSPKCCFKPSPFRLERQDHAFFAKSRQDLDDDLPQPHPLHQVRNQYSNQIIL